MHFLIQEPINWDFYLQTSNSITQATGAVDSGLWGN